MNSFRAAFVVLALTVCAAQARSQVSFSYKPTSASFAQTVVGLASHDVTFVVTNTGTSNITVQDISIDAPAFQLVNGFWPITLVPRQNADFTVNFVPKAAGTFQGHLTITITGATPIELPLQGLAITTTAAASLSVSSMTFNQGVGTTSPAQTVTLTNTGTAPFTVDTVSADPPFSSSANPGATTLQPGDSLPVQVTYKGTAVGTQTDVLVFSYDVLPPSGVALTGTATAAIPPEISTFPQLEYATIGYQYLFALSAAGGTGPYTWSLTSGSTLPQGLTLNSNGTLTGTVASTVTAGNYTFGVEAIDSKKGKATAKLTLPVQPTTGAECQNIFWDVAGTSTPMIAINDLGTGTYLGSEGGLYPNGSNVMPPSHEADGIALAQGIQPLNAAGNPDPNGSYGILSIGESATAHTWSQFMNDADADPSKNTHLVITRGAQPKTGAVHFANINDGAWNTIIDFYLPQAGLTPNQVVAAWVLSVNGYPTGVFPADMSQLKSEYEDIARNLHTLFPNIKLAYFTSKFYDGYANGLPKPIFPEPYAYEDGFAVKWAIQDQINGVGNLNYNPALGPVVAPWMAWAAYDWTNGLIARSDGLTWSCQDVRDDGVHPSAPIGQEKEANILMNFFKADETTTPWFLAP